MSLFNKQIVVIGSSRATKEEENIAFEVGSEIAKNGYILVCGGKDGIMEAACKGAEFFIDDENYARMRKGKIPLKRRE